MSAFQSIPSKPAEELVAPPPLPVGTYLCVIQKVPNVTERGDFDIVEFMCTIMQPEDDVDLSDYPGEVAGKQLRQSFLFSKTDQAEAERAGFQMKQFMAKTLDIEEEGKTLSEMMSEVPGRQLLVTVKWEPEKKPADPANPRIYERIASTAKA